MNNQLSNFKKTVVAVAVSFMAMPAFAGVSGFVDAQISASSASPSNSPNSSIADGAVFFSKELGKGKVMVDLPFSYKAGGTDGDFSFGKGAAQAFINYGYDFGLNWTLGRFDSPFATESNHTVGLTYSHHGSLYDATPHTHNGLMFGYANSGFEVKAIASHLEGNVQRTIPNDTYADNFEYGFLAKYTHDTMWLGAGMYLYKAAGTTTGSSLLEVTGGTKVNDFTIDVALLMSKAALDGLDSGMGVGANVVYAFNKTWSMGIRPEYTSKLTGQAATASAAVSKGFGVTVGPQCHVTDDLLVRADYSYTSSKANTTANSATYTEATTSDNTHTTTISAVYKW